MSYAIGIDLGGSSAKAVCMHEDGPVLHKHTAEFDPNVEFDWAEKVRDLAEELQTCGGGHTEHLGLSAPGLAARDGFSIAFMPGRLHGLEGLNWTKYLDWPRKIPVLNDAHAALLGEHWQGAARGFEDVIMLTLGTGVGGAAIVDGNLLQGHIGRAGHLGHDCLDIDGKPDIVGIPGSIELEIGNSTIGQRGKGKFKTTHDLVNAYSEGDSFAKKVWLHSLRALACSIAAYINILDPEAVIIGGGIARAGKALFEPLEQFLRPIEWQPGGHRVKLIPASLGEYAGAIGAAHNSLKSPVPQEAMTV
jgi:glucokinase